MNEIKVKKNIVNLFKLTKNIVIIDSQNLYIGKESINVKGYDFYKTREVLYATFNKETYRFNENNLSFIKIFDNVGEYVIDKNTVLTLKYLSSLNFEIKYFADKQIKWQGIFNYPFVVDNASVLLERDAFRVNRISKINLENGTQEWHFTLPEGFEISGKIQAVDDVLFFWATKEVNKFQNVYGLDINTGDIIWKQNFQIPYDENNIAIHINNKDNLCYGYGDNLYQVFNPKTGEKILDQDMSEYYKQGVDTNLHANAIYDNKLWFVSGRGENAKFGALNIKTHEIEFIQDYPLENGGEFDKIVYHKDKLYLRDNNNVLHIFENEK